MEYKTFPCGCEVKLYGIGLMYKTKCSNKTLKHRKMIIRKLKEAFK